ncbi:MAG: ribonuclease HII [Bdellovibrio sp.]|nr:ribonuclease HII [Bdellovibrio sp.]
MYQDISHLSGIRNRPCKFPFILQGSDESGRGPLAGPVVGCTVSLLVDSLEKLAKLLNQWKRLGIKDSKKISGIRRRIILSRLGIVEFHSKQPEEIQFPMLQRQCLNCMNGVGEDRIYSLKTSIDIHAQFKIVSKSACYIDRNNILNASLSAMWESGADLNEKGEEGVWYIDGNHVPRKAHIVQTPVLHSLGKRFELIPIVKGDSKMLLIGLASIIAKEFRDFTMSQFAHKYPQYGLEKHAGYPTVTHLEALRRFGPSPIHRRTFKGVR